MKNERIPLPIGTKLTPQLTIQKILSQDGATSITYMALRNEAYRVVIKEAFPFESRNSFTRDGKCIHVCKTGEPSEDISVEDELNLFNEKFRNECNVAHTLIEANENNTIYTFACEDITQDVLKTIDFQGTVAHYMAIGTVQGRTLSEIIENGEISLKQALLYTNKILQALQYIHNEKEMIYFDIKCDNLWFPNQLSPEETFCIFIDYGSAKKVADIPTASFISTTDGYSAKEIQKLKNYVAKNDKENAKKYKEFIGFHTDLYSVGAIVFRLITQEKFDNQAWGEITRTESPSKKMRLIKESVIDALYNKHPYLVDRVSQMLAKAMYFSTTKDELLKNRYSSCTAFMQEIKLLLAILEDKGIHPEVFAMQSEKQLEILLQNMGIHSNGRGATSDALFIQDWLADVKEG